MTQYLLYDRGIRVAELALDDDSASIARRDRVTATWSPPARLTTDERDWQFPGSLRQFPEFAPKIAAARWQPGTSVSIQPEEGVAREFAWRRSVTGRVNGGTVTTADFWLQQGGGLLRDGISPIDLLIDRQGYRLLAALDASTDVVLVRSGYEVLTHLPEWERASPAQWGYRQFREMAPMPDGVRLATDVYLPAGDDAPECVPAILCRTPYGIDEMAQAERAVIWQYCARGYAVVLQDVRGRGASEGEWEYIRAEPVDGDATVTWVASQPWCDGNVGMMGASYPGHAQWMAASRGNPALKALVPIVSMGTPHNDMPFIGGTLNAGGAAWAFMMEGGERQRDDWADLLMHRPIIEIAELALGKPSPLWELWTTHPRYDDYWKASDWLLQREQIDVPALQISGWYDDDLPGTLGNWEMVTQQQRENQRLVLGSWRHGINADREINDIRFSPDVVRPDLGLLIQRWYDRFLKGIDNGVDSEEPVQFFSGGDDRWKGASSWPPPSSRQSPWYLRSGGRLSPEPPDGSELPDTYRYDPADPTPSRILRHLHLNEQSLPDDYREVEARPDTLVYTSAVLVADLEIAGNLSVILYAASSARDTDWVVRLTEVYPDGRSIRLVEGVMRARYRESFEYEVFLTPGMVERYEIRMRAHASVFQRGHRVRLTVASAAAGFIFPNSNTGEDEATVTYTVVADQQIFHDADRPSHVLLPVVHR